MCVVVFTSAQPPPTSRAALTSVCRNSNSRDARIAVQHCSVYQPICSSTPTHQAVAAAAAAADRDLSIMAPTEHELRVTADSGVGSAGLPLYTQQQLLASPSVRQGMDPDTQRRHRLQYTQFITELGMSLTV